MSNTHTSDVFYQTKISLSKDNQKEGSFHLDRALFSIIEPIGDAKFRNNGNNVQKMFYILAISLVTEEF